MDSELKGAIDVLVKRIEAKTAELNNTKKMVNDLCREAGVDPIYTDADLKTSGTGLTVRPDEFYGKSPMSAVREYLEKRNRVAASLEEIRDALHRGGFDFEAQKWPENSQVRNLAIGVSKNSKIFHRLPNGMIGLTAWYPNIKTRRASAADDETETVETNSDEVNDTDSNTNDVEQAKTADQVP